MGKPAAKQGDKIVGTDIHILLIPAAAGVPVPTPTPMPFNGMLSTGLSTDVFIEGKPAATVQSGATNMPPHIPAGGPFAKPPTNQGKIMVGSTGVFINGKPAARQGDTAITCNDPVDAPMGTVMAVGTVMIGETGAGAPVVPVPEKKEKKLLSAKWGQLGKIISAEWEKDKIVIGEEVKLIVETKDFDDGTPAKFQIWEKRLSENVFAKFLDCEVQGNKVEIVWEPSLREGHEEKIEYYFLVEVEGEERTSGNLSITLELKHCEYLEVEDIHFNHDSAVVLPGALADFTCCYLYAMENPSKLLLIAGHTEISGSTVDSKWLSKKRAENVLNILLGRRDSWVESVTSSDGPIQEEPEGKSKIEDYQMILKWVAAKFGWRCDPGRIYNTELPRTKKAIKVFQENYNRKVSRQIDGSTIETDGIMGPETWGAFFDIYILELAELLGLGHDLSRLVTYQEALKFIGDKKIIGCGDNHPVTSRHKSRTDGRVELLFFDSGEEPLMEFFPDCHNGAPEKCELFGKLGSYEKTPIIYDLDHIINVEVLDYDGNPMEDVKIIVERESEGVFKSGTTNANGFFIVHDVPSGSYLVSVDTQELADPADFEGVKKRVEV